MKGIINKIGRLRLTRKAVFSSALITLVAIGGFSLFGGGSVASAATANGCTVGANDSTLAFDNTAKAGSGINITSAGTYTLWLRMMAPDTTNNTFRVSVNGGACVTMGAKSGSSLSPNTWTWVDTQNGTNTVATFNLPVNTNNTMVVVGNSGEQLDTWQLLTNGCGPQDTAGFNFLTNPAPYPGKNCIDLANEQPPTVNISQPTNGSTFTTGASVPITAIANDSIAVTQVVFKVDGVTLGSPDTTSPYTATYPAVAGTHTITATATDTGNQSTVSAPITITVNNPTCSGNPTDPSNLHDTDTAPLPAGKVDLAWTGSTAAANCTLSGYNIYRNGSTTPVNSTVIPAGTTTYSDATVNATTTYTYQVQAVDTLQHVSNKVPTTPLSVTTGTNCATGNGAPTAPTGLAQTLPTDYTTVTLHWNASTISNGCVLQGYHVYRDGSTTPIATLGLVTTFKDNGPLASGTSHNYSVDAFDSGGNKASTAVVAMTTKADDLAPASPTGFTGTNQSGAVALTWTAATDLPNPGAVGVKNYDIYRCTGASCTPPGETSTPNFTSTNPAFNDSTVAASTTYRYVVSAVDNNNNQSSQSATIVTVTTPAPTCSGAPSVPTALHATGATINSISLAWTASTPAAGCTLQGYQVFRNHALITTVGNVTTVTDSGLNPNTSYIYDLIAVETSSSNNMSASTPDFTTSTLSDTTAPTAPTNFVVSAPNPTQVSLGWTASTDNVGVTGYNIYRNGSTTPLKTVTGTSTTDLTVTANTTYTYLLEAVDAAGNKSTPKTASTPATITTPQATDTTKPTIPGKPVAGVVGTNSVALTWTASTDNVAVGSYHVLRNGTQVGNPTSPSFTDSGLTPNTTYTYTIVAVDTSNNLSDPSAATAVTTQPVITPIPGDIDNNGKVDGRDFNILLVHWHQTVTGNTNGDLDNSGVVDGRDLNMFLIDWGIYNNANGL